MVKFLAQSRLQEFYLAPSEGQEEWVGGCGRGAQKSKDNNNSKDNGNNEDNNEDNNDDDDDYKA